MKKVPSSMKQISVDFLIKIPRQPDISCPIIDTLIFMGENASKNYEVDIDFHPEHLKVDTQELSKATAELQDWANGIIRCLSNLSDETKEKIYTESFNKKTIDQQITFIQHCIYNNRSTDLNNYQYKINGIIEKWTELHEKHEEYSKDILSNRSKMKDIEKEFDKKVKPEFERKVYEFTQLLETVRENNDQMRSTAYPLRHLITNYASQKEYDLRQPMPYLSKFLKKDSDISLGILYNKHYEHEFLQLCLFLTENGALNASQYEKIIEIDQKTELNSRLSESKKTLYQKQKSEALIDMLKENGYTNIYYYDNASDFMVSKDSYRHVINHDKKSKIKVNP